MIGLSPEQAQLAWECAVQAAGGCRVTQRLVNSVMSELGFGGPKKLAPQGPTGAERRQALKDGMSELLILLSRRAPYDALIEKAEA